MRQLLFVAALMSLISVGSAVEGIALKTNSVDVGIHGVMELTAPEGWAVVNTNLNFPGHPKTVEVHSPDGAIKIRITICWDGFPGPITNPTGTDMDKMISNVVARQYLPISVEKTIDLEKLNGPGVKGSFVRLTDAGWTPVVKEEHRNQGIGMFRCESLWGDFDLVCNDKDGPQFTSGLKILESLHRKP